MEKGIYINPTTFVSLRNIQAGLTSEMATRQFAAGAYVGFFSYLPDPDPILRKLGSDQTVYKDLLSDDQVGPLVERRKNLTKSLDWDIVAPDIDPGASKQSGAGDAEVELCREVLQTLESNGCYVKDIISQTLDPIFWGYAPFEINFAKINNKILPVEVWEKPREWFFYDNENQCRFRRMDDFNGIIINGKKADPKVAVKFIVLRNNPTYENPYGEKALSRCFWPVTFKRGGMKFYTVFLEKYGMPFLFGKLPRGAKSEDHADLLTKLENMVQDAVGTGPDDSSLQLIERSGTNSGDLHEKYLQRCDNAIIRSLLLNTLSTDIQKSGARAASDTGAITIEGDIQGTDQDFPTTFFNLLFKRVVDLNIGSGLYPTFEVKEIENINKDLSERDKNLDGIGVKFTPVYFERKYNLEEDEFELREPQPPVNPLNPFGNNPPGTVMPGGLPASGVGAEAQSAAETQNKIQASGFKNLFKKLFGKNIELKSYEALSKEKLIGDIAAAALPDKLMQFSIEQTLKPVIELAKNSSSYDEFKNNLAAQYPKMNDDQIQNLMTKVLFIAEVQGLADDQKHLNTKPDLSRRNPKDEAG